MPYDRIYITRHGQPVLPPRDADLPYNPQHPPGDPPLSALGLVQSRKLGLRLKREGFAGTIYASPYRRTVETADRIAAAADLTFTLEPALREFTSPRIRTFTGLDIEGIRAICPRLDPSASLPYPWWSLDPEPADEDGYRPGVMSRVGVFLERIMADHPGDVLLVAHGASTGSAVKYLLDRKTGGEFSHTGRGWNTALTAFRYERDGLVPLFQGDVSHLDDDQITSNSQRPEDFDQA